MERDAEDAVMAERDEQENTNNSIEEERVVQSVQLVALDVTTLQITWKPPTTGIVSSVIRKMMGIDVVPLLQSSSVNGQLQIMY